MVIFNEITDTLDFVYISIFVLFCPIYIFFLNFVVKILAFVNFAR